MRKLLGVLVVAGWAASLSAADVPELIKKLGSKDNEERRAAAKELGEQAKDAKPAVAALTKALKDDDSFVRRWSADALGKIGPDAKPSLPALVAVLKMVPGGKKKNTDKDADLRIEAATALGHIASASDKDALEALRDLGSGKNLKQNKGLGDAIKKAVQEIEMRK